MTVSAFFQDLAVLMTVAGIAAVVFTRLHWPKVIGYLLAGILMSRHTWGGGFLLDADSVTIFGQLGMVFLMFSLGLEFSAGDMKRIKHVAMPTALFDCVVMTWLGFTVGRRMLGWDFLPSLFLGAAICDSATTLLAKTIDEMGWNNRPFVKYIFGSTICEDILCVGVIALITGVAGGQGMTFAAAGRSLGGLMVFFTGVTVFGLLLVPRLLNAVGKMKDPETLLLTLLGCCFLVSFIAFKLDFSLALGAFLMGILAASSEVRQRILSLIAPLRSMFSAIFFVSIGLLVNPVECWHHGLTIIALAAVIILGKTFNCFTMSILTGQKVKDAVQTGFGLAQIGEFAYMVALLYMGCAKDPSNPIYQIVVGASLITTCLNPAMLKLSDPAGEWLENHLPGFVHGWLAAYNDWLAKYRAAIVPSTLQRHIRSQAAWIGVIWILFVAVSFSASMLCAIDWSRFSQFFDDHKRMFFCLIVNLFFTAMLAPLCGCARRIGNDLTAVFTSQRGAHALHTAVRRFVTFVVMAVVVAATFAIIVMIDVNLMPAEPSMRIVLAVVLACAALVGWKRFRRAGIVAGRRFNEALAAEKRSTPQSVTLTVPGDFFADITITEGSPAVGHTIKELDIRARTGASIVAVTRNGERNRNPGANWTFLAGDSAVAIGESTQIAALRQMFTAPGA